MLKLLILAITVMVVAADNSYVVLTPKSFRAGVPLNISVNILKSTAPVDVTATLVNVGTKTNIATAHGQFTQGNPDTLELPVPDDVHTGSYKLQVQGTGSGAHFTNETTLQFETKSISVFIQTDKAMYKPGQTVNFRTFAVFPNLTVYTGLYDIDIYDPNTNKIKQWRGVDDVSGVVTKFMLMDTQPVLGDWKIKVIAHGRTEEKTFTVAHYVLPKFEVTVELPSFILTSESSLSGTVKATYTYGKPVQGTVDIKIKLDNWYRPYNYHGAPPEITQLGLILDGEAKFTVPLDHISSIQHYLNGHNLVVEANVTENLNHITLDGSSEVTYYDHSVKLEFLKSNPNTFKPGLPYTAYLKVAQQDDTPLMGIRKDLSVASTSTSEDEVTSTPYPWYQARQHTTKLQTQSYTIPDNGVVPIQVDIPENSTHMELTATYGGITARLSLSKSYSPSGTYIQLILKSANLRAGSVAMFDIKSTETIPSAVYQVMSRGSVADAGSFNGNTFSVQMNSEMAPNARIIVYYVRTDGEVVTDSISFDVEGAFQNQVSIDFDKSKAQPGESVNVVVSADPESLVHLLAVDQSVLLLKSGNDVTASEVIDELKSYDTITHASSPFCCDFGGPMMVGRKKRMIWWPYPVYYGGSDAGAIFNNAGVKVITDAEVYHHVERPIYPMFGPELAFGGAVAPGMPLPNMATAGSGPMPVKSVERVRSVFPETWLWTNSSVG